MSIHINPGLKYLKNISSESFLRACIKCTDSNSSGTDLQYIWKVIDCKFEVRSNSLKHFEETLRGEKAGVINESVTS